MLQTLFIIGYRSNHAVGLFCHLWNYCCNKRRPDSNSETLDVLRIRQLHLVLLVLAGKPAGFLGIPDTERMQNWEHITLTNAIFISLQSNKIGSAAFYFDWEKGGLSFRKTLLMIMQMTHHPLRMIAGPLFTLNYDLFLGVRIE